MLSFSSKRAAVINVQIRFQQTKYLENISKNDGYCSEESLLSMAGAIKPRTLFHFFHSMNLG